MTNKDKYQQLCDSEPSIPIFSRGWWLDSVCDSPKHWNVILIEKGGNIVASMPYYIQYKYGFILLVQPPLTQKFGPWFRPSKAKYAKAIAEQKDLMQAMIDQLPSFDYFQQSWDYRNLNWLPFYWRNFKQTTRYTYILPNIVDESLIWSGMQTKIRTDIRKAESRFKLTVRDDVSLDIFLQLNQLTFQRQGQEQPYSNDLIRSLDLACLKHHSRKILIAEDSEGRYHAGVYIVWDDNSAYYLMGGSDPEMRNSGATSLCLWYAIRHAATVTQRFDFEGSMMESVERFFRAFGAQQMPYFLLSKVPSRILKITHCLKNVLGS